MRFFVIVAVVLTLTSLVFLQSRPDSLTPKASELDFDKVQGFAERNGLSCNSLTPTLLQYLLGGRPQLSPHFVCRVKSSNGSLAGPLEQAQELKSNFGIEVERYFKDSEVVVGLRYGLNSSSLVCYFPKRDWKWVWCLGDSEKGCFFADCTKGLR